MKKVKSDINNKKKHNNTKTLVSHVMSLWLVCCDPQPHAAMQTDHKAAFVFRPKTFRN